MLSDVVSSVYFSRTIALCTRAYSTSPGPEKLIDVLETRPGTGRTILQCTMTGYNNLQDQTSRFPVWGSFNLHILIPPLESRTPSRSNAHMTGPKHYLGTRRVKSTSWWNIGRAFPRVQSSSLNQDFLVSPGSFSDNNLHKIMKQTAANNRLKMRIHVLTLWQQKTPKWIIIFNHKNSTTDIRWYKRLTGVKYIL